MPFSAVSTTDNVVSGIRLDGKHVLITGSTGGLGIETARALASIGASVTRNESIVAMLGSIMPDPFAIPRIVTNRPPSLNRVDATFAWVSVVRMASAASSKPVGDNAWATSGMPLRKTSIGSGSPITPVDATSISASSQSSSWAAIAAIFFFATIIHS